MCKPLLVETYFCNIFLECGYNYERLQYISASDLDLIFSKREHLGLKSEFREKLQKWKRAQHIDVCAGDTTPTYKEKPSRHLALTVTHTHLKRGERGKLSGASTGVAVFRSFVHSLPKW
nr:uncharacterized protein LOC118877772 [Drosophila suzukii]